MARPASIDRISEPDVRPGTQLRLGETAYLVLRIGSGLLFLCHGLQKLFGFFGGQPVPLASLLGVAAILELVGGTLLVLGLFTRPVAAVLAAEMLGAYVIAHLPRGVWPIENGGETALLFALIFVFFALVPSPRR